MNKILVFLLLLSSYATYAYDLKIEWTFKGVLEGYDHDNRMVVKVDGVEVGTSKTFKETAVGDFTISVQPGKHNVEIKNFALYEGKWDEHSKSNSYSVDASYIGSLMMEGNMTLNLLFDIDKEVATSSFLATDSGKKQPKLNVAWQYTNVIDGYDHINRMEIFIDGKLAAISAEGLESQLLECTIPVTKGSHTVKCVNYSQYEGKWEEHSKANEYSVDAIYDGKVKFKKGTKKLKLVFDIKTETTTFSFVK